MSVNIDEIVYTYPDTGETISFKQLVESCVLMKTELITAYQIIAAQQESLVRIANAVNQHTELFNIIGQGLEAKAAAGTIPQGPQADYRPGQYL